jgi:hypothetical protein
MHACFAAYGTELAYEAYLSSCDSGGVQSSLYNTATGCIQNDRSGTNYRTLFRD